MILKCRLRRAAVVLAVAGIAAVAAPGHDAFASEFKVSAITIETPWSRATPGGAKVAAGYLTIKNDAATPDRLVSVTADIAGSAGIHQMSMADGMMKMRELTDGLPIPAEGSVTLEPASYHLMFQGQCHGNSDSSAVRGRLASSDETDIV